MCTTTQECHLLTPVTIADSSMTLQLFITEYSPYVRMARILLREKNLQSRVEEVLARTRTTNSPYYKINISGRVPFLRQSDGLEVAGSRLILEYLDKLDGSTILQPANEDNYREYSRLEEAALVVMDGISVWSRELKRPQADRSQTVIQHEQDRAARMVNWWETELEHPVMQPVKGHWLNYPQLTLACALCMDQWNPYFDWRNQHPKLAQWLHPLEQRPSFTSTAPPSSLSNT